MMFFPFILLDKIDQIERENFLGLILCFKTNFKVF
jgi:hypothetical protein